MGMLIKSRDWIDARFPLTKMWEEHLSKYYAPKNFNFWYFFGSLALLVLVLQIVTGIFLTMNYKPDATLAFGSVEYIMRDVEWGWLIRYMHSTGASAFFIVVYLHMFRALLYGSYKGPRELLWIFGMMIYLALMAEAFFGYLLPWGQMSYWGAQVIISLFGAIPVIGDDLSLWIRGDFVISDVTLNRFFALHVIAVPFVLAILVVVHILALHEVGSNNPDGIEIKKNKDENGIPKDGIPFHPYYSVKDIVGVVVFLMFFSFVMFFVPEGGGYFLEAPNFEPANPLKTPEHIAPVWYFTPYYAMLRAVTIDIGPLSAKFLGVIVMGAAVVILFFLPWLDRSPVKSIRYRGPLCKIMLALFVVSFFVLGWLGTQAPTDVKTMMAQVGTIVYFAFFLLMPIYTKIDSTKPVPDRITG
ncbi:MAG TPA: cytochrome bc complex cytochrome b subunit [Gammaproteobacteria bacterium]|nr:cytochrome bc complex cytochrome b subunit [Gammaproteobacteria bacterium]